MPIWPGIAGCSSMFILTSFTLPLAARTVFSRIGPSCLHGAHQGAQKSTSTGWRLDSSMTSLTKVCVVVSLTNASAVAVPACCNMCLGAPCLLGPGVGGRACPVRLIKWEENGRMQSRFQAGAGRYRLDARQVTRRFEELEQSVAGYRRRRGVHQGMKVEHPVRHHGGIEHN